MPPSPNEEVLAHGACRVLADVLTALGPGATRALWRSAWARVDRLVSEHGGRLARPAMRCLCAAANAEGKVAPILVHLRGAVRVLQAEVPQPSGSAAFVRAAWIAASACEFCDLDKLIKPHELGYPTVQMKGGRPNPTTGAAIAVNLLRIYGLSVIANKGAALPALILALGFALRRHSWLAARPETAEVFKHGLAGAGDSLVLAEKALEALAALLEHLALRAEAAGASSDSAGPAADEAMAHLSCTEPAVLKWLGYGLHRTQEAQERQIRARAFDAAVAFHRAGLGHPGRLAHALFAPLFTDHSLRRKAAALLSTVAERDPNAVVAVVGTGVRSAFAAMLWQAPHMLSLNGAPGLLARAAVEVRRTFTTMRAAVRARWLRSLLAELQSLQAAELRERLPPLPAEASAGRALAAFGGRSRKRCKGSTFAWQPSERLSLSYGHFVANLIVVLPLSETEVELLTQETTRYLEFRAPAALSAYEHGGGDTDLIAVCASTAFCRALAHAFSAGAAALSGQKSGGATVGMARLRLFQDAVCQHLQTLEPAARAGSTQVANWLTEILEEGPKLRNASRRGRKPGHSTTSTPRAGKRTAAEMPTPTKQQLPAAEENTNTLQSKRLRLSQNRQ